MGRPSKFTADIRDAIIKAVETGLSETAAAELSSVTRQTLAEWKKLAADSKPHAEFLDALTCAHAKAEALFTGVIRDHATGVPIEDAETPIGPRTPGDWRAAAFWLKCRRADVYGDKVAVDMGTGVADAAAFWSAVQAERAKGDAGSP